jgi:phospholipid transport system transporter-binding protein
MKEDSTSFQIRDNIAYLKGELCLEAVSSVLINPQAFLQNPNINTIDLHEVTKCDTAGLALLLEWLSQAKKSGKQIRYINMSQPILDFAAIHKLTNLLFHDAN